MDGATNELAACGYGRAAELRRLAEDAGERWARKLGLDLYLAGGWERLDGWRGIGCSEDEWPEDLWELFCCDEESLGLDEDEVLAMREPFTRSAALWLDYEGYSVAAICKGIRR